MAPTAPRRSLALIAAAAGLLAGAAALPSGGTYVPVRSSGPALTPGHVTPSRSQSTTPVSRVARGKYSRALQRARRGYGGRARGWSTRTAWRIVKSTRGTIAVPTLV